MNNLTVTIENHLGEAFDVTLPDNVPVERLIPEIQKALNLPATNGLVWNLSHPAQQAEFNATDTLAGRGVKSGDTLRVTKMHAAA